MTIVFITYIFMGIANKATTGGVVWTCRCYVFNLDNSNTAGMYLYAIYCLILMHFFEEKGNRICDFGLLTVSMYMIWRTEARTCIAATVFVTAFGILYKKKKLPTILEIACFAFPIVFIFGYLWLFYSGFKDIAMGDKNLFSGRQETFVTYLNYITGGSPEMLDDKTGIVVDANDIEATEKAIKDICEKKSATMRNISLRIQKNLI